MTVSFARCRAQAPAPRRDVGRRIECRRIGADERPDVKATFRSLTGALRGGFRLGHFLLHLRLDRVEIEAGAALHRRIVEESLDFLAHQLLDEDEAPELILEPVEVLLRAVLRAVVRPAGALERIEAQVGDVGHVRVRLLAEPARGLVDEPELVIVDAHRADRAFAKIEDLVTRGWSLAGDGGGLVIAIQMVLVSPVADRFALEQFVGDVWIAGDGYERR